MSFAEQNRLDTRLQSAAAARAAMLSRFRAQPGADDPAVQARQAERRAVATARAERVEAREQARLAEQVRLAALAEAERQAEIERKAAELAAAAERAREMQAKQKEERDARYAARKAKVRLKR